jgi:hypothetical protein
MTGKINICLTKIFFTKIQIIFGVLTLIFACRPECENPRQNLLQVQFVKRSNFTNDTLSINQIRGLGQNLAFIENKLVSGINLPFNLEGNQLGYIFTYQSDNQIVIDTLILGFTRNLKIIKPACGISQEISDLKLVKSTFDSVIVVNTVIENRKSQPDLRIFK